MNKTPRIIFERAAPMYEANLRKIPDHVVPDDSVYEEKIRTLEGEWSKWQPRVFKTLAEITGLDWQESDIRCYVVSGTKASFSHPLTLKLYDSPEVMFDTFVHELIHRLLKNPNAPESVREARKKFMEPYETEPTATKYHIILHALHAQLALVLFGEERMQRIIEAPKNPDYIRAWDIVRERGRESILEAVFGYKISKI